MKKREIIFFAVLFVAALVTILVMQYAPSPSEKIVRITIDGDEYESIAIDEDTYMEMTVIADDGVNEVLIHDGMVDVVSADCPNQVCVDTKEATKAGDIIVCLPHKVVIEIVDTQ